MFYFQRVTLSLGPIGFMATRVTTACGSMLILMNTKEKSRFMITSKFFMKLLHSNEVLDEKFHRKLFLRRLVFWSRS